MLELPLTLARLLERHPDKIETIENETDDGCGYWLYLQPGWCGDDLGCHTLHEDTVKDILSAWKYVQECNCSECRKATGQEVQRGGTKPSGFAGLIRTARNPILKGDWVSIYRATEAGLDPDGGKYVTVCEEHGTLCNHQTLKLANLHLRAVDWCEACMAMQEGVQR